MTARQPRPSRSLGRSAQLLRAFRTEQADPDGFYGLLSADAVALLAARVPVAGRRLLDVGGGAGYLTVALRSAGARCVLVDADASELAWRGAPPPGSVVADGTRLPVPDGAVDLVVSSNVLEHVAAPFALVDEMARVLRPGGHLWVSFTNWLGPWGGHETSPWHLLGGERACRRYERRTGRPPKNRYGESLFPLHVGPFLRRLARTPALELVDARPRYLPAGTGPLVRLPLVRELCTWNLEVLARRRA
ncbi:MAG: class I SAM-dependent methyltransferase [Actinomycetota bacterium]|nr:class I SAM-dependent methyltransferase [Actinomycetota bacterium]